MDISSTLFGPFLLGCSTVTYINGYHKKYFHVIVDRRVLSSEHAFLIVFAGI